MYWQAFGRSPTGDELRDAEEFVQQQGQLYGVPPYTRRLPGRLGRPGSRTVQHERVRFPEVAGPDLRGMDFPVRDKPSHAAAATCSARRQTPAEPPFPETTTMKTSRHHCGQFAPAAVTRRQALERGRLASAASRSRRWRPNARQPAVVEGVMKQFHLPPKRPTSSSCTWTAGRRRSTRSTTSRHWKSTTARVPTRSSARSSRLNSRTSAGCLVPLEVQAVRPSRTLGQRLVSARRSGRRRTGGREIDDYLPFRSTRTRITFCTPGRACKVGPAWCVDYVRARQRMR